MLYFVPHEFYNWVMLYCLLDARKSIIRSFDVLHIKLPEREKANLVQIWSELKQVEAVGAWRSLCALSGQVIEGLLRQKMLMEGFYTFTQVSGQTLGQLIDMARHIGLFPVYAAPPSARSSITTAQILRNWASHNALWYNYPTEMRATQSLVLTVATVEGLFPKTSPVFTQPPPEAPSGWWTSNWHSVAPATLISHLSASDRDVILECVLGSLDQFYAYVLRNGMPSSVFKLLDLAYDEKLDQALLCRSINDEFLHIVCNASRSSVSPILETVWRLRKIGLKDHASLLSILLPFDDMIFERLLDKRSPAWVARYVAECFRAEPDVFSLKAGDISRMQHAIAAFWRRFAPASGNIINAANILDKMPPTVRVSILADARVAHLVNWVSDSDPLDSVNLLAAIDDQVISLDPHLVYLRDQIVQEICVRIRGIRCSQLHALPLRLHRLNMANRETGLQILSEVLDVTRMGAESDTDWDAIRRILWDTYVFYDQLRAEALRLVQGLVTSKWLTIPQWTRLCFVGMLEVAGGEAPSVAKISDEDDFLRKLSNGNIDRWQRFLAALGFSCVARRLGLTLPAGAMPILRALHAETKTSENSVSNILLAHVEKMVSILS